MLFFLNFLAPEEGANSITPLHLMPDGLFFLNNKSPINKDKQFDCQCVVIHIEN